MFISNKQKLKLNVCKKKIQQDFIAKQKTKNKKVIIRNVPKIGV